LLRLAFGAAEVATFFDFAEAFEASALGEPFLPEGFDFAILTSALTSSSFLIACHPEMPRRLAIWPKSLAVYSFRDAAVIKVGSSSLNDFIVLVAASAHTSRWGSWHIVASSLTVPPNSDLCSAPIPGPKISINQTSLYFADDDGG